MTTRVTISDDALFQEVSGELVILDLATEQYFGLNEMGARIWVLLKEGNTVEQVKASILAEYEVESQVLDADVAELLNQFSTKGLARIEQI